MLILSCFIQLLTQGYKRAEIWLMVNLPLSVALSQATQLMAAFLA